MKKLLFFLSISLVVSACNQKSENPDEVSVVTGSTVVSGSSEEESGDAGLIGTWKLFKKEDKEGKILPTDDQFLEFKSGNVVDVKSTSASATGEWYVVAGADARSITIKYLVIQIANDDSKWGFDNKKKFFELKTFENDNLVIQDERGKTLYFQKY